MIDGSVSTGKQGGNMEVLFISRVTGAAIFSLLVTMLSGCSSFMQTSDESPSTCPSSDLPANQQPFDTAARQKLQQFLDRDNEIRQSDSSNPVFIRLTRDGKAWRKSAGAAPWACVQDKRTNLFWEVKTDDPSLRGQQWTYTWYEPALVGQHNYAGKPNGGKCQEGNACDTQSYVDAVNAANLCGYSDWRLPSNVELHTLLNRSDSCPGTCIDQRYFPNTSKGGYWSSSQFGEYICYVWGVDFELGDASGADKNTPLSVRLVRGEWNVPLNDSDSLLKE